MEDLDLIQLTLEVWLKDLDHIQEGAGEAELGKKALTNTMPETMKKTVHPEVVDNQLLEVEVGAQQAGDQRHQQRLQLQRKKRKWLIYSASMMTSLLLLPLQQQVLQTMMTSEMISTISKALQPPLLLLQPL